MSYNLIAVSLKQQNNSVLIALIIILILIENINDVTSC